MPSPAVRRPAPLSAEVCDGFVPTLLGRTSNVVPTGVLKKPIGAEAASMAARLTPGSTLVPEDPLSQNLGLPSQWAFTPMATPSPWGARQNALFHRDNGLISLLGPAGAPPAGYCEAAGLVQEPCPEDDDMDQEQLAAQAKVTEEQIRNAPRPPPGAIHPSKGSEDHYLGTCRRCCFFPRARCANGYECTFCHYEHDKRKRKTRKGKRNGPPSPVSQPMRRETFPPGTFTAAAAAAAGTTATATAAAGASPSLAPPPVPALAPAPLAISAAGPPMPNLSLAAGISGVSGAGLSIGGPSLFPPMPPMQPAMQQQPQLPLPPSQGLGLLSTTMPLCKVWGSR